MKRIFLTGYMGSGKSTLGLRLAQKAGLSFIDLDHYIETRFRKTINEIFTEKGEDEFRLIERNMLREIGEFEDIIIATGGGAPCFFDNIDFMNKQGVCIYLKTSPEALFRRLKQARANRPLLREKSDTELLEFIKENLARRKEKYEQSSIIFDTGELDSYEEIDKAVNQLLEICKKSGTI
ncbi:shikimate kinase [Coprobacter sp.]